MTPYYPLDLDSVYRVLPGAIASEIVSILRYQQQHCHLTISILQNQIHGTLKEHREDEQEHLGRVAERLKPLRGVPDLTRRVSRILHVLDLRQVTRLQRCFART